MSILDDIRGALTQPLAGLATQLGVPCTVYRKTAAADASDGTPRHSYVADASPALVGLHGFFAVLDTAAAQKKFGMSTKATGIIVIPRTTSDTLVSLAPDDGVEMTGGPFAGWKFLAEKDSFADPTGSVTQTALVTARGGLW